MNDLVLFCLKKNHKYSLFHFRLILKTTNHLHELCHLYQENLTRLFKGGLATLRVYGEDDMLLSFFK